MTTLRLAIRNLSRNRRRTVTTLFAMVVASLTVLLFGGYTRDIGYSLQTDFVHRGGHLQIQHRDFFVYGSGNLAAYGIEDYARIIDTVKNDPQLGPMLSVVTPILQVHGVAGNFSAGVSRTVAVSGIVVADQNRMRAWNDYGFSWLWKPMALTGADQHAAVIGTGVARALQLCHMLGTTDCPPPPNQFGGSGTRVPQDVAALASLEHHTVGPTDNRTIELLAATVRGAPNVARLEVIGTENQRVKEIDDLYVAMHLAEAQQLIYGSHDKPRVTAIVLQLNHTHQLSTAKARLDHLLATEFAGAPLTALDFDMLNPSYKQTIAMFDTIFGAIAILIGIIVIFTVSNTMSMAVMDRVGEIGTLRAIGLKRGGILRLFVCEAMLLGFVGAISGVLLALVLAAIINHSGLTWTPPGRIPIPLTVRVWGESTLMIGSAVGLVLVAVVSAWWPSLRAARLNIVEALRHV